MITVTCVTEGCENFTIPVLVPDDGTQVLCGAGCNNTLRESDPTHPDYPIFEADPEPSLEELVDQRLRDLGII